MSARAVAADCQPTQLRPPTSLAMAGSVRSLRCGPMPNRDAKSCSCRCRSTHPIKSQDAAARCDLSRTVHPQRPGSPPRHGLGPRGRSRVQPDAAGHPLRRRLARPDVRRTGTRGGRGGCWRPASSWQRARRGLAGAVLARARAGRCRCRRSVSRCSLHMRCATSPRRTAPSSSGCCRSQRRWPARCWRTSARRRASGHVRVAGSAVVAGFALWEGGGALQLADLLLVGAVISAAIGYAEGARLSRTLGGWQVISWALVLAAPFAAIPDVARARRADGGCAMDRVGGVRVRGGRVDVSGLLCLVQGTCARRDRRGRTGATPAAVLHAVRVGAACWASAWTLRRSWPPHSS